MTPTERFEQVLKENGWDAFPGVSGDMLKYMTGAYNMALEDAAESARVYHIGMHEGSVAVIDKNSILKLRIKEDE